MKMLLTILSFIVISCGSNDSGSSETDTLNNEESAQNESKSFGSYAYSLVDKEYRVYLVQFTNGITTKVNIDTKTTDRVEICEEGRICRGMSRSEVLEVVGEPETVDGGIFDPKINFWRWNDAGQDYAIGHETPDGDYVLGEYIDKSGDICNQKSLISCHLKFYSITVEGVYMEILYDSYSINSKYLDPTAY